MAERLGEVPVALVEKGKQPGSHLLSGAVVNPIGLKRLFGDRYRRDEYPSYGEVHGESVYVLSRRGAVRIPPPPTMKNHGNLVFSLSRLGRWLAEHAEEGGAMILPETAAEKLLVSHGRVVGARTGDKGRDRDGKAMGNFEPGADLVAKVTVLAEGTQGHLTGVAIDRFGLAGAEPQVWELGVKEVWKVPRPLRDVVHTMGWPLRKGGEVPRVRRLVPLPDGRRHAHDRDGRRARLPRRRAVRARPAAGAEDASEDPQAARGRRARRLGREDDPERRLPRAAVEAARAGAAALRRRRRHGQHPAAEGRALRDRVGAARGRVGVRGAQAAARRRGRRSARTTTRSSRASSTATSTRCATCARCSGAASSSAARSPAR